MKTILLSLSLLFTLAQLSAQPLLDSSKVCIIDTVGTPCEAFYNYYYTYNNYNQLIEQRSFGRDFFSGQLVLTSKYEFTYDTDGNRIQSWGYRWDGQTAQWVNSFKTDRTYNNSNQLYQSTNSSWLNNQWEYLRRNEYYYNADGDVNLSFRYTWDNGQWTNSGKREYTYTTNTANNTVEIILFSWNNGSWDVSGKIEETIDNNGMLVEDLQYNWNTSTNQWEATRRGNYYYDSQNNFTNRIIHEWNATTSQWDFDQEYVHTNYYNTGININYLEQVHDLVQVYPNPVKEVLQLEQQGATTEPLQFNLIDAQGRTVLSQTINSYESLDMSSLPKGLYFYQVITENKTQSGKLIKQ